MGLTNISKKYMILGFPSSTSGREPTCQHRRQKWCRSHPSLEEDMATHPSALAWRIPGMGEPGELPSMGSHRVRHDWSDLAAAAATVFHCCSFSLIPPNCQPCPPNCDSEYVITFFSMLKKNYSTVTERTDCRWDLTRFGSKVSKKEKGQDQYTQ